MTLFVLLLLLCSQARASSPVYIAAEPAFDGMYSKGKGLPVRIILENRKGDIVKGTVHIAGGTMKYSIPVILMPYSMQKKWIVFHPQTGNNMHLNFASEKDLTLQQEVHLIPYIGKKDVVVYISKEKGNIHSLSPDFIGKSRVTEVTPQGLWNIWNGYEQADYVLLDADAVEFMMLSQLNALKRYVLSGGVLYISGKSYTGVYNHDFFKELLPVKINGLVNVRGDFFYPSSPPLKILSLKATDRLSYLHKIEDSAITAGGKKGDGRVILLSFDPADKAFHPFLAEHDIFSERHDRITASPPFPGADWSEEIRGFYMDYVKWNAAYLLCFIPLGFVGKKGMRKILLLFVVLLFITSLLSSTGILNGRNQLKGMTVLRAYHNEKDVFIRSELSLLSTKNTSISAEFKGGYLYPLANDRFSGNHEIIFHEKDNKKLTAHLGMLGYEKIKWNRFEELDDILNVSLIIHNGRINGDIKNLSKHALNSLLIGMNGNFSPLPPIKGGELINVAINIGEDALEHNTEKYKWMNDLVNLGAEMEVFQKLVIVGVWEKPVLKLDSRNLITSENNTVLIYSM